MREFVRYRRFKPSELGLWILGSYCHSTEKKTFHFSDLIIIMTKQVGVALIFSSHWTTPPYHNPQCTFHSNDISTRSHLLHAVQYTSHLRKTPHCRVHLRCLPSTPSSMDFNFSSVVTSPHTSAASSLDTSTTTSAHPLLSPAHMSEFYREWEILYYPHVNNLNLHP